MKKLRSLKNKNNQGGLATIESLPILVIFIILISYGTGMFGAVHTSILYSISARTYAFETLRNRTNYTYFRDVNPRSGGAPQELYHFGNIGFRLHGIDSTEEPDSGFLVSTTRPITLGRTVASKNADDAQVHNNSIYNLERRNREGGVEVNPVWIMVQYGICINARCGE